MLPTLVTMVVAVRSVTTALGSCPDPCCLSFIRDLPLIASSTDRPPGAPAFLGHFRSHVALRIGQDALRCGGLSPRATHVCRIATWPVSAGRLTAPLLGRSQGPGGARVPEPLDGHEGVVDQPVIGGPGVLDELQQLIPGHRLGGHVGLVGCSGGATEDGVDVAVWPPKFVFKPCDAERANAPGSVSDLPERLSVDPGACRELVPGEGDLSSPLIHEFGEAGTCRCASAVARHDAESDRQIRACLGQARPYSVIRSA